MGAHVGGGWNIYGMIIKYADLGHRLVIWEICVCVWQQRFSVGFPWVKISWGFSFQRWLEFDEGLPGKCVAADRKDSKSRCQHGKGGIWTSKLI